MSESTILFLMITPILVIGAYMLLFTFAALRVPKVKSKLKIGDTVYFKTVIKANAIPEPYTVIEINIKSEFTRFPGVKVRDRESRIMTFYENTLTTEFFNAQRKTLKDSRSS